jgi:hypothetical protein
MAAQSIETTDIFRSAYFLCNGGDLCGINIKDNGRRVAVFVIRGEGLGELDRQYRNGKALVNPVQFRESITHLRDLLFDRLKTTTRGETRHDRKRENRSYKAAY